MIIFKEFISDTLTLENPKLKDLDINFHNFFEMTQFHLKPKRKFMYHDEKLGDFPDPLPPKPLPEDYELNKAY